MSTAESLVLVLAVTLMSSVAFAPSLSLRTSTLLIAMALVAIALVCLHRWLGTAVP